ncbi:MAG: hypothetical protein PVJ04_14555 [Gemmatimonadota bacterium]
MKKDILAAITFLATGLLFYVVHDGAKAHEHASPSVGCGAAETVYVEKSTVRASGELPVILDGALMRDS